ncbi:hypothetical protein [Brevundimonas sp. NPDC058933]|uniref:hypothetical protein n=1 Tax=Brevundimonas sp. NPDC058933 TaxID=3346673 RepID=UPI003BEEB9E3
MAFGQQITIGGAAVSANLGLAQSKSNDADAVAAGYGSRLLMRVSTRDVRRTADNPTGAKRVHPLAPNRDPLLFMGSGVSVGAISGKYGAREVFAMTATGNVSAGTANDLKAGPKSLNGMASGFTLFGVAHYEASMLGSGFHALVTMLRDGSQLESMLVHQFAGGINYMTAFSDQGDSNGVNVDMATVPALVAGAPFAYCLRIKPITTSANVDLWINNLTTPVITSTGKPLPEAGQYELLLGHTLIDSQQWSGGHGDAYVIQGDALATLDDKALATALMLEMKAYYGIG